MFRRTVLIGLSSAGLAGCLFDSQTKRIGAYHWIWRIDGDTMLAWGNDGEPICGIDYYDAQGNRTPAWIEAYGVTKTWIIVKTNIGYHAVSQSDNWGVSEPVMTLEDIQTFLKEKDLEMPRMKEV